jgi:hypothetical protein
LVTGITLLEEVLGEEQVLLGQVQLEVLVGYMEAAAVEDHKDPEAEEAGVTEVAVQFE